MSGSIDLPPIPKVQKKPSFWRENWKLFATTGALLMFVWAFVRFVERAS